MTSRHPDAGAAPDADAGAAPRAAAMDGATTRAGAGRGPGTAGGTRPAPAATPSHPEPPSASTRAPALRGAPPHAHAALRAERVRVAHWRRLVRARMDLAAAAVALPEGLGEHVPAVLPDGAARGLPTRLALADAVSTGGPEGEVDRLEALRRLDVRLARYELTVTRQLHAGGVPFAHRPGTGGHEPGADRPGPGPMGQTVPRT